MKRLVLLAVAVLSAAVPTLASAREIVPRVPVDKKTRPALPAEVAVTRVIVKFHDGSRVRLRDGKLVALDGDARDAATLHARGLNAAKVKSALRDVEKLATFNRLFTASEAQLAEGRRTGEEHGEELADLDLFFEIAVPAGTTAGDVSGLLRALNALDVVEIAYAESVPEPAGLASAGRRLQPNEITPDFQEYQYYLGAAPTGINALYAWTQPGGKGAGVSIVDVERTWHLTHEDLPPVWLGNTMEPTDVDNHGTAVLGMLGGKNNGLGVRGIVTDAAFGAVSTWPTSISNAIQMAATHAGPQGVVMIEVQILGPRRSDPATCWSCSSFYKVCDYVAVEWDPANWAAIKNAVSNGTVVVEAAGNGQANLDASYYNGVFSRSHDSGAIFVGASESEGHAPTCFTNYGSRVDLHAWGWDVATLGYGNWWHAEPPNDANRDRWYTRTFSGTSSATPMVVGSVASVRGGAIARGQGPLTPAIIRDFLRKTGTQQGGDPLAMNIGPMPDLQAAHFNLANNVPPVSDFTSNCTPATRACQFDGSLSTDNVGIVSYAWTFGDGTTSTEVAPAHSFTSYGPYTVTLTVTDTVGVTNAKSTVVSFDSAPTANFTVTCSSGTCTANGSSSTDDHGITAYRWTWGDGQTTTTAGAVATHSYAASGTYSIVLTVTDTVGQTGVSSPRSVTVNAPPRPSFFFNCVGLRCDFDASATTEPDGDTVTYRWFLGATQIGSGVTMTYSFAATGTYDVTLQTSDSAGSVASTVRRVSVTSESSIALWHWNNGKPCRVYDSRVAGSGAKIASGTVLSVPLVADAPCSIPVGTQAVLLNVVAVQPTGNGNLKVWGVGSEPITSALNFTPSWDPRASNVTVRVANGSSQTVSVKPSVFPPAGTPAETHILVDVVGFYGDSTAPAGSCGPRDWCGPMGFRPIAQCRMLDTRTSGGQIDAGVTRYVKISDTCSIPPELQSAMALSMNVTALPLGNGNLVAFDSAYAPEALASVSTLNYRSGRNQPNGTVIRVSSRTDDVDDLAIQARVGPTNVILDVNGYFASRTLASNGMAFYPVAPCRALDTRAPEYGYPGRVTTGVPANVQIAGNCGIPRGAKAVVVYATAFNPSASGNMKIFPAGAATPPTSILNFLAGDAIGNSTIIELGTSTKDLTLLGTLNGDATSATDVILDVYGYFAPAP